MFAGLLVILVNSMLLFVSSSSIFFGIDENDLPRLIEPATWMPTTLPCLFNIGPPLMPPSDLSLLGTLIFSAQT